MGWRRGVECDEWFEKFFLSKRHRRTLGSCPRGKFRRDLTQSTTRRLSIQIMGLQASSERRGVEWPALPREAPRHHRRTPLRPQRRSTDWPPGCPAAEFFRWPDSCPMRSPIVATALHKLSQWLWLSTQLLGAETCIPWQGDIEWRTNQQRRHHRTIDCCKRTSMQPVQVHCH